MTMLKSDKKHEQLFFILQKKLVSLMFFFCVKINAFHPANKPECIYCGCVPTFFQCSQGLLTTWLYSLLNKVVQIIWLNCCLASWPMLPMFKDLSITARHFGQNYDNKAVINQIFPLKGHKCYNISPFQLFLRSVSCLSRVQFAGFSSESLCERIMDAQSSILVTAGRSSSQNTSTRRCDVLERSGAAKMVFKL